MMAANSTPCRIADQVSGRRQGSCSKKMSALAAMFLQRLCHDAYVRDPRLLHRIHHGRESAKRHVLIGAQQNGLPRGVTQRLMNVGGSTVKVDGIVAKNYPRLTANADAQPLL